jgi:hypothetical protein
MAAPAVAEVLALPVAAPLSEQRGNLELASPAVTSQQPPRAVEGETEAKGARSPRESSSERSLSELPRPRLGLALSGGGIRSASFASGLVCELLERGVDAHGDSRFFFSEDVLISAVSGGSYLATALVDWAAREQAAWRGSAPLFRAGFRRFFANMRRHVSFLTWSSIGAPTALFFAVALLEATLSALLIIAPGLVIADLSFYLVGERVRKAQHGELDSFFLWGLGLCALLSLLVSAARRVTHAALPRHLPAAQQALRRAALGLKAALSTMMLWYAMLILACLLIQSSRSIPFGLDTSTALFVLFLSRLVRGPARVVSVIAVITYVYARALSVLVDARTAGFGLASPSNYDVCFYACVCALMLSPVLLPLQQRFCSEAYRHFLESSFYHPTSRRGFISATAQATLEPFFPAGSLHGLLDTRCGPRDAPPVLAPLRFSELPREGFPELCVCMTANKFEEDRLVSPEHSDESRTLFLSQRGCRLVLQAPDAPGQPFGAATQKTAVLPIDLELGRGMALSSAAVSFRAGYTEARRTASGSDLFFLGFQLGALIPNSPQLRERSLGNWLVWWAVQAGCFGLAPLLAHALDAPAALWVSVAAYFAIVLLAVWVDPVAQLNERWHRGVADYVLQWPAVHLARAALAPRSHPRDPLLQLSDGGHHENLALLPQLLRRTRLIFVADCSSDETGVCLDLFRALHIARRYLRCQFRAAPEQQAYERQLMAAEADLSGDAAATGSATAASFEETDVEATLHRVIERLRHVPPAKLRQRDLAAVVHLQVRYEGDAEWSDLFYLKIVSPDGSPPFAGQPPTAGALCDSCVRCLSARPLLRALSDAVLGRFPQHDIANQWFAPAHWSAYHSLGVQAMRQAMARAGLWGAGAELRVPEQEIASCEPRLGLRGGDGNHRGDECSDCDEAEVEAQQAAEAEDAAQRTRRQRWACVGALAFLVYLAVPVLVLASLVGAAAPHTPLAWATTDNGARVGVTGLVPHASGYGACGDGSGLARWNSPCCAASFCRRCMLPGGAAMFCAVAALALSLLLPPTMRWRLTRRGRARTGPPRRPWAQVLIASGVALLLGMALSAWGACEARVAAEAGPLRAALGWWLAMGCALACAVTAMIAALLTCRAHRSARPTAPTLAVAPPSSAMHLPSPQPSPGKSSVASAQRGDPREVALDPAPV